VPGRRQGGRCGAGSAEAGRMALGMAAGPATGMMAVASRAVGGAKVGPSTERTARGRAGGAGARRVARRAVTAAAVQFFL
jgi:hypothetical protein